MKTLDNSRPGVAAQAVGIAAGRARRGACTTPARVSSSASRIASFQGIQFMLADMATQVEAARALIYAVARDDRLRRRRDIEQGVGHGQGASPRDVAMKVTTDAVQIFGGYGYMKRLPGREDDARRQDHPDLRGHEPDPERCDSLQPDPGNGIQGEMTDANRSRHEAGPGYCGGKDRSGPEHSHKGRRALHHESVRHVRPGGGASLEGRAGGRGNRPDHGSSPGGGHPPGSRIDGGRSGGAPL